MRSGTTTLEDSLEVSYETEHRLTIYMIQWLHSLVFTQMSWKDFHIEICPYLEQLYSQLPKIGSN